MAKKRSDKKPLNPRVTGDGPATGEQYLKLQQKLGLELAEFQALLGTSVKDHYQIAARPDEPLADPGLALHVCLLDEYPELVVPEPAMEDLVRAVKRVKRDYPDTAIPMPATAGAVALMLGRRSATASTWSDGRVTPARKIMALVRHLLPQARAMKETLLAGDDAVEAFRVAVPGSGGGLFAGALGVALPAARVRECVQDGFFPLVEADTLPLPRRSGLREMSAAS